MGARFISLLSLSFACLPATRRAAAVLQAKAKASAAKLPKETYEDEIAVGYYYDSSFSCFCDANCSKHGDCCDHCDLGVPLEQARWRLTKLKNKAGMRLSRERRRSEQSAEQRRGEIT